MPRCPANKLRATPSGLLWGLSRGGGSPHPVQPAPHPHCRRPAARWPLSAAGRAQTPSCLLSPVWCPPVPVLRSPASPGGLPRRPNGAPAAPPRPLAGVHAPVLLPSHTVTLGRELGPGAWGLASVHTELDEPGGAGGPGCHTAASQPWPGPAWPPRSACDPQASRPPRGSRGEPVDRVHSLCLLGAEGSSGFSPVVSPSSAILPVKPPDT